MSNPVRTLLLVLALASAAPVPAPEEKALGDGAIFKAGVLAVAGDKEDAASILADKKDEVKQGLREGIEEYHDYQDFKEQRREQEQANLDQQRLAPEEKELGDGKVLGAAMLGMMGDRQGAAHILHHKAEEVADAMSGDDRRPGRDDDDDGFRHSHNQGYGHRSNRYEGYYGDYSSHGRALEDPLSAFADMAASMLGGSSVDTAPPNAAEAAEAAASGPLSPPPPPAELALGFADDAYPEAPKEKALGDGAIFKAGVLAVAGDKEDAASILADKKDEVKQGLREGIEEYHDYQDFKEQRREQEQANLDQQRLAPEEKELGDGKVLGAAMLGMMGDRQGAAHILHHKAEEVADAMSGDDRTPGRWDDGRRRPDGYGPDWHPAPPGWRPPPRYHGPPGRWHQDSAHWHGGRWDYSYA